MSRIEPVVTQLQSSSVSRLLCPSWCVAGHRADLGEEDWLHSSEPVPFIDAVPARLVMSIDPDTGEVDGPYVLIGTAEYSLTEASASAARLLGLVSVHDGTEARASTS